MTIILVEVILALVLIPVLYRLAGEDNPSW